MFCLWLGLALGGAACRRLPFIRQRGPVTMREVPAARLAFKFQPDNNPPQKALAADNNALLPVIKAAFDNNRREQLLARTVLSPDGQRALAIYATAEEQNNEYRVDMFSADGNFLRNVTPPSLAVVFPDYVDWSPDGQRIVFLARQSSSQSKAKNPDSAPTPLDLGTSETPLPGLNGTPDTGATPNNGPVFAPVPTFATEQVYLCDRDGYNMKSLTNRNGLIYFFAGWAPDSHALAALACREDEWSNRERAGRPPAGRPRLLAPDGQEIILSDALVEAFPVWSPDSAKVAVGFDTEIEIYDAATATPTRARLSLRQQLWQSSITFDQKTFQQGNTNSNANANTSPAIPLRAGAATGNGNANAVPIAAPDTPPASFQPFVRLLWPDPTTLYGQTAFVRLYANGPVNNFPRWHLLALSPQANAVR